MTHNVVLIEYAAKSYSKQLISKQLELLHGLSQRFEEGLQQ